ncbi:MAG: hypothetical protein ERJ67_10090 [Aphanocapsa feldmannii 277cV]|uniref:Uncharacterized protein n=1 Tax=Aphanocapsa feldmannii 277cV TaxID=2507553 RepID=A0A524RL47_9CHRO|nr:MAG: hypothetical protein ERJ67_10090 [Aphanocapsa feldmannii 277cV]
MFTGYLPSGGYDEYFAAADQPRRDLQSLVTSLGGMGIERLRSNHQAAERLLKQLAAYFCKDIALQ